MKKLSANYKVIIFTTRNSTLALKWVSDNGLDDFIEKVTNVKEPAYLIVDDRCITFDGDYEKLQSQIENFKVWYR